MNIQNAIKEVQRRLCCEQPIAHFCNDCCMYSYRNCPIAILIEYYNESQKLISKFCHEQYENNDFPFRFKDLLKFAYDSIDLLQKYEKG